MNEKEDYFRITKTKNSHILSNRIPISLKQIILIPTITCIMMIILTGWLVGLVTGVITMIGYILYRFASWLYYSEIEINEKSGHITLTVKLLNQIQKTELITRQYNINNFEFSEINQSGKTKFLLKYKTHKNHELLILKNEFDKLKIQEYLKNEIS